MNFDFENPPEQIEFGVALSQQGVEHESLQTVPSEGPVKQHLFEMAVETRRVLMDGDEDLPAFDPGNDVRGGGFAVMPRENAFAMRPNWIADGPAGPSLQALDHPDNIVFYFARFHDAHGRQLTGVRTARMMKGVRNRFLIFREDDHAKYINREVLSLDHDFDFLIDDENIYIRRPGAFEILAALQEQVMAAAADNVATIGQQIPFLNMGRLATYASTHATAARMVASIVSREDLNLTDEGLLRGYCLAVEVQLEETDDGVGPEPGNELDFLKVLDRRRFHLDLTGNDEVYDSPNRQRRA